MNPTASETGSHLITLVRKEFIRPDRAIFLGDDGFRFGHVLIRDAAYESIPKRLRAELHERFASWLEAKLDQSYQRATCSRVSTRRRTTRSPNRPPSRQSSSTESSSHYSPPRVWSRGS